MQHFCKIPWIKVKSLDFSHILIMVYSGKKVDLTVHLYGCWERIGFDTARISNIKSKFIMDYVTAGNEHDPNDQIDERKEKLPWFRV